MKALLRSSYAILAFGFLTLAVFGAPESGPGRERLLLNRGWRFALGEAAPASPALAYDLRPEVRDARDDVAADSRPQEAEALREAGQQVLKAWILPTANAFITDSARRHQRPAGDPGSDFPCVQADFDDSGWRLLDLPHDWGVEHPFLLKGDVGGMGRLPSWGVAWYRRKLDLPACDAGKSVFLEIEGAMSYATVWLNGHLVGGWPYGYASWQLDLTPYVKPGGDNQLAIRLDNPPSSARWYPGGGLYRSVWLTKTRAQHVAQWGTVVRTLEADADKAALDYSVTVDNDASTEATVQLSTCIRELDALGEPVGALVGTPVQSGLIMKARSQAQVTSRIIVAQPKLWGPVPEQRPNRYVAVTTVSRDGTVLDSYETRFGIRTLRYDPDRGLLVNGQHIAIRGVNQHHDLGALGAAFNVRAAERQLELLRDMGCNALRMSHNPPAPELLELADRMGFLVMDEIFDCWERKKTPLDFHLIFPDWHEPDLRAFIRRDRNHPSVFAWSIGNEVGEQYTDAAGAAIARQLVDIAREEDPTRPATCAMNYAGPEMPLPAELGIISLNYQGEGIRDLPEFEGTDRIRKPPQYDFFHRKFPSKMILSSEAASAFSSRGVYLFPVAKENSSPVRDGRGGDSTLHQVSSYELYAVDFGSSADKVFAALETHPFVAGQFVWTGWDHLGEPTPYYSSRGAYCGIIDIVGFPKDRFYLYQSQWRPELPMAHILPHWTWPGRVGQMTPVHVFTSGDEAELFLNGRSLGRKIRHAGEYRLRWDEVVYEPGVLEVVAYRKGRHWATDTVRTAGAEAALLLQPDRTEIRADGCDLSFVAVRLVDAKGALVPHADRTLHFSVEGAGAFVASDNGDPTNLEALQGMTRKAFNGLCMVILRSKPGQEGVLRLRVTAEGLDPAVVEIRCLKARP
jgi:beta-galactosidase